MKSVLVLSPHGDDAFQAAGGVIRRWVESKYGVKFITFSLCSNPELKGEILDAGQKLGLKQRDMILYDFERRVFPSFRQKILDVLWTHRRRYSVDVVLTPSTFDTHQDHQVVTAEARRTFKDASILGYEEPWNTFTFRTDVFYQLGATHVEDKLAALRCFKSQLGQRTYFDEEYIRSALKFRGQQIEAQYAEAFEAIRIVESIGDVKTG